MEGADETTEVWLPPYPLLVCQFKNSCKVKRIVFCKLKKIASAKVDSHEFDKRPLQCDQIGRFIGLWASF